MFIASYDDFNILDILGCCKHIYLTCPVFYVYASESYINLKGAVGVL